MCGLGNCMRMETDGEGARRLPGFPPGKTGKTVMTLSGTRAAEEEESGRGAQNTECGKGG